jgi:hypothetical protein
MSGRELRLLVMLGVILGTGGVGIVGYQWFYKPLQDYNAQIRKLTREIDQKQDQVDTTRAELKLLEDARSKSLSPRLDEAFSEYDRFLAAAFYASGLDIDSVAPSEVPEVKQSGNSTAARPQHRVVKYAIRAKGDMEGLVKLLEAIHRMPMMHRIKTLGIDRVDATNKNNSDRLNIGLTIEAMMVSGADTRETRVAGPLTPDRRLGITEAVLAMQMAPAGLGLLPWIYGPLGPSAHTPTIVTETGYPIYNERRYEDLILKNIFRGGEPPTPKQRARTIEDEDYLDVTQYVRLDTTDPDNREAFFRNLVVSGPPKRIKSSTWSGFNQFQIKSEHGTRVLVTGKVLRIDQRDVYFQVLDEIYGIHLGQSLADAMGRPLRQSEIDRLELARLYDADWADKQAKENRENREKQQTAKKKKGR